MNDCNKLKKIQWRDKWEKIYILTILRDLWVSGLEKIIHIPLNVVGGNWIGWSFGWDRKTRQQVWYDKDSSLLKGLERRADRHTFCIPSPAMMTYVCAEFLSETYLTIQCFVWIKVKSLFVSLSDLTIWPKFIGTCR